MTIPGYAEENVSQTLGIEYGLSRSWPVKLELDVMEKVSTQEQLDRLFEQESAVLFKHSTRCPISAHAYSEMKRFHEANGDVPFFILHVVEDRPLSDYVTKKTGIRHESPQLFLLERGKVCWHASHFDIAAQPLEKRLGKCG